MASYSCPKQIFKCPHTRQTKIIIDLHDVKLLSVFSDFAAFFNFFPFLSLAHLGFLISHLLFSTLSHYYVPQPLFSPLELSEFTKQVLASGYLTEKKECRLIFWTLPISVFDDSSTSFKRSHFKFLHISSRMYLLNDIGGFEMNDFWDLPNVIKNHCMKFIVSWLHKVTWWPLHSEIALACVEIDPSKPTDLAYYRRSAESKKKMSRPQGGQKAPLYVIANSKVC